MLQPVEKRALTTIALAVLGLVALYWESFQSIGVKWYSDAAYSHGYLIVPIVGWLIWRKRTELASAEFARSWAGVAILTLCVCAWVVARGTGVLVLEQLAVVAMIPALVLALLGRQVAWILVFPLSFLLFAVPFGRGLIPWFMEITADISTTLLQAVGVPIYRSYMYINIPSGRFEVAKACSGLRYVITGMVLGVLYAHVAYRGWKKRVLCVLAFLVVPIIANGLRVFVIITIAHLTKMGWGGGPEHVTFGRIFFLGIMFLMFWIGRRWADPEEAVPLAGTAATEASAAHRWLVPLLAVAIAVIGPLYLSSAQSNASAVSMAAASDVSLPSAAPGWRGPVAGATGWKPLFVDELAERSGVYEDPAGGKVDVYVGVYGLGASTGSELIGYKNRIFATEHESLAKRKVRTIGSAAAGQFEVVEQTVQDDSGEHLVWYWYMVGDRHATTDFGVKFLEALAFASGNVSEERIITLSTPLDADSDKRIMEFAEAHLECLRSGLDSRNCKR